MYLASDRRLKKFVAAGGASLIAGGLKGIEKESLRVTADGSIAQTAHPRKLGSALTHPSITTDYSEALLEFITPPLDDLRATLNELADIHAFAYQNLDDEMLWATSMPCVIGGDDSIPIAEYGTSNVGQMKHVYRRGLDHRYGRVMQAISGVHYNFSLPEAFWPLYQQTEGDSGSLQDFRSEHYFRLIRNFQRLGWLIPYLFGASPALCKSFMQGRQHRFEAFDQFTLYAPHATSLRMSDIGYKNKAQANLHVCYNSIDTYIDSLSQAISTPDPEYAAIGTLVDGEWRQLNTNVLQIENEYYSFIRPKRATLSGERPTLALRRAGVEYVEIRALDVSAFQPLGVDEGELRFLEAFLLLCLFEDSAPISQDELREIGHNQAEVALRGRDPELELIRNGAKIPLRQWALELCTALEEICSLLDAGLPDAPYQRALDRQMAAVRDPDLTPSARMLAEMRDNGESFIEFAVRLSQRHQDYFRKYELSEARREWFTRAAEQSLAEQAALEADSSLDFQSYLNQYFAQG